MPDNDKIPTYEQIHEALGDDVMDFFSSMAATHEEQIRREIAKERGEE